MQTMHTDIKSDYPRSREISLYERGRKKVVVLRRKNKVEIKHVSILCGQTGLRTQSMKCSFTTLRRRYSFETLFVNS